MVSRIVRLTAFSLCIGSLLLAQNEDGYNSNERILKIRELGKKGSTAIPVLAQYSNDPNRDIRIEAVKAIVKIGTERSLDPLVQATHDKDEDVEIRATDGLVNYYSPGYLARGGLTGAMTRGVRQVKGFFYARNDRVVEPDVQIRPDVAQAISDVVTGGASFAARANAALAAGILRDRAALPALEQALHAKDSDLIFESLIALQKVHEPSAGTEVGFLAHDLDDRIQSTALETIGVLRSVPSAPNVRLAFQSARNLKIRRAALQALAVLGQPDDRPVFLKYADDRDVDLRASALEGLGRVREPQDFPTLENAFDEGEIHWRIHLAAAFAMVNEGKVDDSEFSPLPYLVESLRTKARADTATVYLTELAVHLEVVKALIKMMPELDRDQKVAFCTILANAPDPDAASALSVLAKDVDPNVALAASKALRIQQTRKSS